MLSLLVVVGLLVAWYMAYGGGGGGGNKKSSAGSAGSDGKNPASSITPGPSSPGPAISDHPGGRDEASDGGASGGSAGSTGGEGAGPSSGTAGDDADEGDPSGRDGGSQAGGDSGSEVPAGSSLRVCTPGAVQLSLRSVPNSYSPGEDPRIQLTARNTSGTACKIDLGPERTVLTITRTDGDKRIWASNDCPRQHGSLYLEVPGRDSITRTTTWPRKPTSPHCATPPATPISPGTYLVEAQPPGFSKAQTSFVLNAD